MPSEAEPFVEIVKLAPRPTAEEIDAVVDILIEAFGDDDIVTAMAGWIPEALDVLMRYRIREGHPDWETYVAKVDGKIQGVGLVVPPGKAYPPDPEEFTKMIDADTVSWQQNTLYPSMKRLDDIAFGAGGQGEGLYLNFLAVKSTARKFGLGSKILDHLKSIADEHKVDFTLNAEHTHLLRYYSKRGLEVRGEAPVVIDKNGKYIPAWGLVNPYRAS